MASFNKLSFADPILITGSAGFVGSNLAANLAAAGYTNLLLFDIASPGGALETYAKEAKFVFHLAGVNRPKDPADFYTGNTDLTARLHDQIGRAHV